MVAVLKSKKLAGTAPQPSQPKQTQLNALLQQWDYAHTLSDQTAQQIADLLSPFKVGDRIIYCGDAPDRDSYPDGVFEVVEVLPQSYARYEAPGYRWWIKRVLKSGGLSARWYPASNSSTWQLVSSTRCESRQQFLELLDREQ